MDVICAESILAGEVLGIALPGPDRLAGAGLLRAHALAGAAAAAGAERQRGLGGAAAGRVVHERLGEALTGANRGIWRPSMLRESDSAAARIL